MREGHDNAILEIDGKFVGINFGADSCAEHEWGIARIRYAFGMNDELDGLEKRIIRTVPLEMKYGRKFAEVKAADGSFRGFEFSYEPPSRSVPKERLPLARKSKKPLASWEMPSELWTAWSGEDFAVVSDNSATRVKLHFVYEAILRCDAAIWLGGGGVFQNAGFVIAVASELPKHVTDAWFKSDLERRQLLKDAADTGIEKTLRSAGKEWYALSPCREKDGTITFWLNPTKQDIYSRGRFTVEQLRQWASDEGPVVMTKKQVAGKARR